MRESGRAYGVLMVKHEEMGPLERPGRRWKDNNKMDFREVEWGMDWIDLAQNRNRWRALVNAVMNLRVPQNAENFLSN